MSAALTGRSLSLAPLSPTPRLLPTPLHTGERGKQLGTLRASVRGAAWHAHARRPGFEELPTCCAAPAAAICTGTPVAQALPLHAPALAHRYYTANVAGYPACNSGEGQIALSNNSELTPCTLGTPGCYGWTQVRGSVVAQAGALLSHRGPRDCMAYTPRKPAAHSSQPSIALWSLPHCITLQGSGFGTLPPPVCEACPIASPPVSRCTLCCTSILQWLLQLVNLAA